MQRPPTIASVGDLVNDPWSSSAPKLRHEQKEYPPWAEQGLEPSSNCSSITIHPGVVQHKVADVVVKVEVFSDLTFGLLDDLKGPTQLAHDDPAPLSANGLTRGRRLVLYNCISQKSAYTNISHFRSCQLHDVLQWFQCMAINVPGRLDSSGPFLVTLEMTNAFTAKRMIPLPAFPAPPTN